MKKWDKQVFKKASVIIDFIIFENRSGIPYKIFILFTLKIQCYSFAQSRIQRPFMSNPNPD